MLVTHIHDALAQVQQLRTLILEKRLFRGYSGIARICGAAAALLAAAIMSRPGYPATPTAHLLGWGVVLAIGLTANYIGLLLWFCCLPAARRSWRELIPAGDAIPALAVGGGLSLALILHGDYDLLFGTWMCLYGLTHMPYRNSLPYANYLVGIYYLLCGGGLLVWPGVSFTNPWPMGIVFGAGELAGGCVLCKLNKETARDQEEESAHEDHGR